MEASDRLINLSKNSHNIFTVRCDLQISDKCRKEYSIEYRRYQKVLQANHNKIVCLFCSRTLKFSGRTNPNTKYKKINDNYFSIIDSSNKAYLLGWIASDGHVGKRGFKISIHQKDIEILKFFAQMICPDIPIRKFTNKTSKMCSYEVNSQQISKDLCSLLQIMPGKKSNTIKFPLLKQEFNWDFIRGYFDGDGSINDPNKSKYPYPKGNIRSNSLEMLSSIKYHCNNIGSISGRMYCLSNKNMMLFMNNLYRGDRMRLTRKYNRFQKWKKKLDRK